MFCTKCGNEISETDAFCPSCGAPNAAVAGAATEEVVEATENVETVAEDVVEDAAANPFAVNSTSNIDPTNPFAQDAGEAPKKKGKIWIPIVAVLAAVVVFVGIAYAYSSIIVPKRERAAVLSATDTAMSSFMSGDVDTSSFLMDGKAYWSEDDIQQAEEIIYTQFQLQLGVEPGDELKASIDRMFRAMIDRIVESYEVDDTTYYANQDAYMVDVNVTGIDVNSIAELDSNSFENRANDYIIDNMDTFMELEESEWQAALVNGVLPGMIDEYTESIKDAESKVTPWTFYYEKDDNGQITLSYVDTKGSIPDSAIDNVLGD